MRDREEGGSMCFTKQYAAVYPVTGVPAHLRAALPARMAWVIVHMTCMLTLGLMHVCAARLLYVVEYVCTDKVCIRLLDASHGFCLQVWGLIHSNAHRERMCQLWFDHHSDRYTAVGVTV